MKFITTHTLDLPQKLEMGKFKMKEELFEKIRELTIIDLKHKTKEELFLSLSEEIGELSKEILIAEKVYGNTYKKPDEDGVLGESVDAFICSMAMHFAEVSSELKEREENLLFEGIPRFYQDSIDYNGTACFMYCIPEFLYKKEYLLCASIFYKIYYYYSEDKSNSKDCFIEYCNKKLDKWINKTKEQT